jgi:hypothetical protein
MERGNCGGKSNDGSMELPLRREKGNKKAAAGVLAPCKG